MQLDSLLVRFYNYNETDKQNIDTRMCDFRDSYKVYADSSDSNITKHWYTKCSAPSRQVGVVGCGFAGHY